MAEPEKVTALGRLFGATARAHHEATGGPNPDWAYWYGEHLAGKIDAFVGFSPEVEVIAEWQRGPIRSIGLRHQGRSGRTTTLARSSIVSNRTNDAAAAAHHVS